MSSLKKRKNSFMQLVKKIMAVGVNLKKSDVRYTAVNKDSAKIMERKGSSSRSRNGRVPHGYFAVYVGEERQRFVIHTGVLSHPVFLMLLQKAEEEYGFNQSEGLAVPCDVETFQNAMFVIHSSESASGKFDLESLLSKLRIMHLPQTSE